MTTAFVLSGGGSLGAVQVGMLRVLYARGIVPDLVVGTSVGALNAAWVAAHPGPEGVEALAKLWMRVRRDDVFPYRPWGGMLAALGRRNHLVSPANLSRLIEENLGLARLEDARLPVHVVATDVESGMEILISSGDATEALLASAAIPGVFPPVRIGHHHLMDGGVADNTPISHAVRLGAGVVYVLPTGYACDLDAPPRSALGMGLHALTLLIEQRLIIDVARFEQDVEMHVLPPLCPLDVGPTDFGRAEELIARAERDTAQWLSEDRPRHGQAHFLGFHVHDD